MYVQRMSRAEIRGQLILWAILMLSMLLQGISLTAKSFEAEMPLPYRIMNFVGGVTAIILLGYFLLGIYRWRKQGQGYRASFLTRKSLVFKRPGQPFFVVKPGDVVGFIPRRYALTLRDGRVIPLHADFWSLVSPHPEPLVRELFRLWWPGISLETVRAAQREANRLPEGFWLAVLYISGGALSIALLLGLILESMLLPALFLSAALVLGLAARCRIPFFTKKYQAASSTLL